MTAQTLLLLKQQSRDARRKLILDTARDLFATKDFRSVTVREIAKSGGMSIGTIYNYYANLTELFLDVFLHHMEELIEKLDAEDFEKPLSIERLCEIYITYLEENMAFYQMMGQFMLGGELSDEGTDRLNLIMKQLMDRIVKVVQSNGVCENPRLISHTLLSTLNGIMISYARYPGRSPEEIRRHVLRLAGVAAGVFNSAAR